MLGWLLKKSQNSRVYMCIQEVKWDLEMANQLRRATILAIAQIVREEALESSDFPRDVLDRPLDYPRDYLMNLYEKMESIRNINTLELEQTKKNMRTFGMELPEFAVTHAKNAARGLEVWMCTVGAGITPDRRDDVREIWHYLSGSFDSVGEAISGLRATELKTAELTGVPEAGIFSDIEQDEWVEACHFVPASFVPVSPF